VTLAGNQTAVVTVVIATTAPNNQSQAANHPPATQLPTWLGASGGVSFAGLAVFFLGSGRRRRYLRACGLAGLLTIALISVTGLTGCSSGNKYAGTPAGTSTITVTATSGTVTQTSTISLTVPK
jgi:hypothetical protein